MPCGIYKITNIVNRKMYIGQSIDMEQRWKEHIIHHRTGNQILYKAMRKYGIENFKFEIQDICNEEDLNNLEIYYIWYFNTYVHSDSSIGYNMTTGGNTTKGFRLSDDTKLKISNSLKGKYSKEKNYNYGKSLTKEQRQKISNTLRGKYCGDKNPNYGKKLSDETKSKISKSWESRIVSDETKTKMSEARTGSNNSNSKPVVCNDNLFLCIKHCVEYYGEKQIKEWVKNKKCKNKNLKGYYFVNTLGLHYASEEEIYEYTKLNKVYRK